ncbi:MAG: HAD family hydrolase [Promethearchaeota archaeon]
MIKKRYLYLKLAIFDLDGTIVHFNLDYINARREVREYLLLIGIPEKILNIKNSILDLLSKANEYLDNEGNATIDRKKLAMQVNQIVDKYEKQAAETTELLSGLESALKKLLDEKVHLAVCTLNTTETAKSVLEKHGILQYFDLVVGRDVVGSEKKPNPGHILYILNHLGVYPKDACMIGDHPADIEMAMSAGIKGVAILSSRHEKYEFSKFEEIVYVHDENYSELADAIKKALDL